MSDYLFDRFRDRVLESAIGDAPAPRTGVAPGKVSLTSRLALPAASAVVAEETVSALRAQGRPAQRKAKSAGSAINEEAAWNLAFRPDLAEISGAASASGGQAMPGPLREKFERAFEADFSAVRIHEGERAGASGAHALTQGTDIHFAPGEYQPETQGGQDLLGHELTHVVQQSRGRVATTQAKMPLVSEDDALEREADSKGAKAARGEKVGDSNSGDSRPVMAGVQGAGAIQYKKKRGFFENMLDYVADKGGDALDFVGDMGGEVIDKTKAGVSWGLDETKELLGTDLGPGLINWKDDDGGVNSLFSMNTDRDESDGNTGVEFDIFSSRDRYGNEDATLGSLDAKYSDTGGVALSGSAGSLTHDDGSKSSLLNMDVRAGDVTDDSGTRTQGLNLGFNVGQNEDTDGGTRMLGGADLAVGNQVKANGERTAGLSLSGGLYQDRQSDGSVTSILGLDTLIGHAHGDGYEKSGFSLAMGLYQQSLSDGSSTSLLGLDALVGHEQGDGYQKSGVSVGGGVFQSLGSDGSSTSLLGLDGLMGYQQFANGNIRAGLSLQGGGFHHESADGSQTSFLAADLLMGHQTYEGGGQTSGVDLGAGLLRSDDLGDGSKFNLLGADLLAGYQVGADGKTKAGLDLDAGVLNYESMNGGDLDFLGLDGFIGYRRDGEKWNAGIDLDAGVLSARTPDGPVAGSLNFLSGGSRRPLRSRRSSSIHASRS